jgi:hypothetical protein
MTEDKFLNKTLEEFKHHGGVEFNFVSSYKHSFVYALTVDGMDLQVYLGGTGDDIYREEFLAKMSIEEFVTDKIWMCGFAILKINKKGEEKTYHYHGEGKWTEQ